LPFAIMGRGTSSDLGNDLLSAVIEYSLCLQCIYSLPSQLPPMVSRELRTLILSSMMQALAARVCIYGVLAERANALDLDQLAVDFFQRMLCDCTVMIQADPRGSFGYILGALALNQSFSDLLNRRSSTGRTPAWRFFARL